MGRAVVIQWGMSSYFGWGIYGLNLALAWSGDPDIEPVCALPIDVRQISFDALRMRRLAPFLAESQKLVTKIAQDHKGQTVNIGAPVLAALGNDFGIPQGPAGTALQGKPTIGVVFFEIPQLDPAVIDRAKAFPLIVTGSTWNERILREYGVTTVKTVIQGVDPTVFHPAPRYGVMQDRFLVFSGGKLELRKGQDLVMAAFAKFSRRHPDALLVTAWHSPWPQFAKSVDESRRAAPVVFDETGKVDVVAWGAANGVAASQIIDLGAVPNAQMPPILREMDVALFPNRSEGGTNLVAMECMACGVPTILSANTGHLDLIEDGNCYVLNDQSPMGGAGAGVGQTPGWGVSSVDEIVETLEAVYADRAAARARGLKGAETLSRYSWSATARSMKDIVLTM